MVLNFEIDYNELEKCKKFIEDNNILLMEIDENGPSGGNPMLTIHFDNKHQMVSFADLYFGN